MEGERSTEIVASREGAPQLRLAGPFLNVQAYDIVSRVETLALRPENSLTVDVTGITDIDITGLVALRQAFDYALARGAQLELRLGAQEQTTLGQLCVSMLSAARRARG